MKYLGINLITYVQSLPGENHKTLMSRIKEEPDKRRNTPCSWVRKLSPVECQSFSAGSPIHGSSHQDPRQLIHEYQHTGSGVCMETRKTQISPHNTAGEEQS